MSFLIENKRGQSVHFAIGNWCGILTIAIDECGFQPSEDYSLNGVHMSDADAWALADAIRSVPPKRFDKYTDPDKLYQLANVLRGGGVFVD